MTPPHVTTSSPSSPVLEIANSISPPLPEDSPILRLLEIPMSQMDAQQLRSFIENIRAARTSPPTLSSLLTADLSNTKVKKDAPDIKAKADALASELGL
jgi:hypothetical protein